MAATGDDFDMLEQYTVILNLTDNTEISYALSAAQKEDFERDLRDRWLGWRDTNQIGFILASVYPNRVLLINTAYLLKVTFSVDFPYVSSNLDYRDNFNVIDNGYKTGNGFVKSKDDEGSLLPQLIVKLAGSIGDTDVLVYNSLDRGGLGEFGLQVADPTLEMREFIELVDSDGESNFLPVKQIVCMEGEPDVFEETDGIDL